MNKVRPKKSLGQHFLRDANIAARIADSLTGEGYDSVLEVGPGMGILTKYLLKRNFSDFRVIEIDDDSVQYLRDNIPELKNIIQGDFLAVDLNSIFDSKAGIAGNFPYNISSQILFRVLDHRDKIVEVTGMFQKEVAERICASPGSKVYGILSVLIQAFYTTEYLFTVSENVFVPPPRVKSGVLRLRRNENEKLSCDEKLFFRVVKACFNQRRKMIRNSVRAVFDLSSEQNELFSFRPEQLSVEQFIGLTNWVEANLKK